MATAIPTNRARITEKNAAIVTGGVIVQAGSGDDAVGIFSDSRAVVAGSAFVALKGSSSSSRGGASFTPKSRLELRSSK
jgi:hypothetical protein